MEYIVWILPGLLFAYCVFTAAPGFSIFIITVIVLLAIVNHMIRKRDAAESKTAKELLQLVAAFSQSGFRNITLKLKITEISYRSEKHYWTLIGGAVTIDDENFDAICRTKRSLYEYYEQCYEDAQRQYHLSVDEKIEKMRYYDQKKKEVSAEMRNVLFSGKPAPCIYSDVFDKDYGLFNDSVEFPIQAYSHGERKYQVKDALAIFDHVRKIATVEYPNIRIAINKNVPKPGDYNFNQ